MPHFYEDRWKYQCKMCTNFENLVLYIGHWYLFIYVYQSAFLQLFFYCLWNSSCYSNIPQIYVFLYRISVDAELLKYVDEHFPGGECAVYCTDGKGVEKAGGEIELTAVISNSSYSPKNFRYASSWISVYSSRTPWIWTCPCEVEQHKVIKGRQCLELLSSIMEDVGNKWCIIQCSLQAFVGSCEHLITYRSVYSGLQGWVLEVCMENPDKRRAAHCSIAG